MKRKERLTPSQVIAILGTLLVVATGVLALLQKIHLIVFWLTIGVLYLYVRFYQPKLRARETRK